MKRRVVLNCSQNHRLIGGSDRYYFEMADLLSSDGWQVVPFAVKHEKNDKSEWDDYFPDRVNFEDPNILDGINYLYSFRAKRSIDRLLMDVYPDIAHLHIYYGQLTSSILGSIKSKGIPIVQTMHEFKLVCPTYLMMVDGVPCMDCKGGAFWRAVGRRCNRGSLVRTGLSVLESYVSRGFGSLDKIDKFIAVSSFSRDRILSMGIPSSKVCVVHNFVDCSRNVSSYSDDGYFFCAARIERAKGCFLLLDVAEFLPHVKFVVAGHGGDEDSFRREIFERRLSNVNFVGFHSGKDLDALYRRCRAVVVPTLLMETFGLVVTEAFAYGKPVVASRIGAIPELVQDMQDGLLCGAGDIRAFVDAIDWLSSHPTEASVMGRAGRFKVEKYYSPSAHLAELKSVYRSVGVKC